MGETQQTMMNLVSDKVFVFQPVVTEKSQGGFQVLTVGSLCLLHVNALVVSLRNLAVSSNIILPDEHTT